LRRLHQDRDPSSLPQPLDFDDVTGIGQLDDVMLVDQSPIGRSPRSNPVTYLKAFDAIRTLFAELPEARARGFTAGHFSFNVDGGRCEACQGDGVISIDMQFMADITMRCRECHGRRYRREVLEVKYRGRDIAEVLDLTAREAFSWFRGERAIQSKLKPLLDVGLDYLRLGQPAKTLSGGEAQRLKLAAHLAGNRRGRTLFLLDEPTTGLHFSDIVQLMDCFDALIDVGHSLVIIEHNLQLMKAADYLIDLGPGAADDGGCVVAAGTPDEVAACAASLTGRFLSREFARDAEVSSRSPS
jgi:excinuclease ABC subunit A